MKNIAILATVWVLLMSGCAAQNKNTTEYAPDFERGASAQTADFTVEAPIADDLPMPTILFETSIASDLPMFTFETSITDGLPAFTFAIYECEVSDNEFFSYTYDVRISCTELSEYNPQSIKISSAVKGKEELREHYIDLVDIDFDGYADMQAATSEGMVNVNYVYFRWNVFIGDGYGEFEQTPFFEMLTTGYRLHPDTKQIICMARDNAVNHPREMYQLGNTRNGGWLGEYKVVRREEQELIQGENGEDKITVRVFFEGEEFYAETALAGKDEYDTSLIGDNYLRFGIGNPIDIETAVQLLYQEYGDEDIDTGFRYFFMFEEMILHEKLSCYKFRMQRLVDGNHWSTTGFLGVTPDGRVYHTNE